MTNITIHATDPEAFRKSTAAVKRQEERQARSAEVPVKRPITVTVSGPMASGKTTLIALIAQALRSTGHYASVPAVVYGTTLDERFDVTFVEQADSPFDREVEEAIVRRTVEMRKTWDAKIIEWREANIALVKQLDAVRADLERAKRDGYTLNRARDALAEQALIIAQQARRLRELEAQS